MLYPRYDIRPFGPSSGTHACAHYHLAEKDRIIVVENILMLAGGFTLFSAPGEDRHRRRSRREPRPAVMESLERSLVEHADVWTELAKY